MGKIEEWFGLQPKDRRVMSKDGEDVYGYMLEPEMQAIIAAEAQAPKRVVVGARHRANQTARLSRSKPGAHRTQPDRPAPKGQGLLYHPWVPWILCLLPWVALIPAIRLNGGKYLASLGLGITIALSISRWLKFSNRSYGLMVLPAVIASAGIIVLVALVHGAKAR